MSLVEGEFGFIREGVGSFVPFVAWFQHSPCGSVVVFPVLQGDFLVSLVLFLQVVSSFGPTFGILSVILY